MKIAIIKSSQLDIQCWSAHRFTHSCEKCNKLNYCDLPEAILGKRKILTNQITKTKEYLANLIEQRLKLK